MAYSRMTKIIGGAVGAGIIGLGCYHTGRRVREHLNQHQDTKNIDTTKSSDTCNINFDTYFHRSIEVGLCAAKIVYDFYDLFKEIEQPLEEEDNNHIQDNAAIAPHVPGPGGDAGENEPAQAQREENGGGDAPQFFEPLAVWGEDAHPPF